MSDPALERQRPADPTTWTTERPNVRPLPAPDVDDDQADDETAPPAARPRVPHNLQAEKALLGAMLLSADAIDTARARLTADDFYKPTHGHLFDVITETGPDAVAAADLYHRRHGADHHEAIALLANDGITSNAARYTGIVAEHSLLRALIGIAGEIAEAAYSAPPDVDELVDRCQTMLADAAARFDRGR